MAMSVTAIDERMRRVMISIYEVEEGGGRICMDMVNRGAGTGRCSGGPCDRCFCTVGVHC